MQVKRRFNVIVEILVTMEENGVGFTARGADVVCADSMISLIGDVELAEHPAAHYGVDPTAIGDAAELYVGYALALADGMPIVIP